MIILKQVYTTKNSLDKIDKWLSDKGKEKMGIFNIKINVYPQL